MLIFSLSLLTVERYNKSIWCKRSRYVSWWWSVSGPGKHNKKSSTKNRTHMYYDGAFNLFCLWIKKLEFFDRKIAPEGEKCIAIWINLVFYNTARMLNFSWKMKEKSYNNNNTFASHCHLSLSWQKVWKACYILSNSQPTEGKWNVRKRMLLFLSCWKDLKTVKTFIFVLTKLRKRLILMGDRLHHYWFVSSIKSYDVTTD